MMTRGSMLKWAISASLVVVIGLGLLCAWLFYEDRYGADRRPARDDRELALQVISALNSRDVDDAHLMSDGMSAIGEDKAERVVAVKEFEGFLLPEGCRYELVGSSSVELPEGTWLMGLNNANQFTATVTVRARPVCPDSVSAGDRYRDEVRIGIQAVYLTEQWQPWLVVPA
ncbi:MAG: hypothetical protein QM658_05820 [Gordonia sp. (in: high G+C Gram-positive bacteria)]